MRGFQASSFAICISLRLICIFSFGSLYSAPSRCEPVVKAEDPTLTPKSDFSMSTQESGSSSTCTGDSYSCRRPSISVESVRLLWPTAIYSSNVLQEQLGAHQIPRDDLSRAAELLRKMTFERTPYESLDSTPIESENVYPSCSMGGFHARDFLIDGKNDHLSMLRYSLEVKAPDPTPHACEPDCIPCARPLPVAQRGHRRTAMSNPERPRRASWLTGSLGAPRGKGGLLTPPSR
jgi:hypothetical protein